MVSYQRHPFIPTDTIFTMQNMADFISILMGTLQLQPGAHLLSILNSISKYTRILYFASTVNFFYTIGYVTFVFTFQEYLSLTVDARIPYRWNESSLVGIQIANVNLKFNCYNWSRSRSGFDVLAYRSITLQINNTRYMILTPDQSVRIKPLMVHIYKRRNRCQLFSLWHDKIGGRAI